VTILLLLLAVAPSSAPSKGTPVKKLVAQPVNTSAIEAKLIVMHGEASRRRVEQGLRQVASLWRDEDGDLGTFAIEHFISDPRRLDATFNHFQTNLEHIDGHLLEIGREIRRPTELDLGPLEKVDPLFAAWDPSAHLVEDFFASKVAFVALLNFPLTTLDQRLTEGPGWTRRQWAEAKLTERFARRIPAAVQQAITAAQAAADLYVAHYNVWMHHVLSESGERLFPPGKRLISHWNLRDELKAQYADPKGLPRQRAIVKVMERIVTQTLPSAVIDNPRLDWNPFTNSVTVTPAVALEGDAPAGTTVPSTKPEPDIRYQRLWASNLAQKGADPFSPTAPSALARTFALGAGMSEARVKQLLESVLTSPLVPRVAAEIQRRLGRPLEPIDLWFNGFLPRGSIPESELDEKVRARYPNADAFAKDIPRILKALGFSAERATYLSERIKVDAARGAGHALGAARRGDFSRLRTRIEKEGMNFKGYNIAIHELGHNVEQVFSLYDVDHSLLAGVPNTAFTEAIAFVFQARDLELLGLGKPSPEQERLRVLNDFWSTWEIAGVALVDLAVWHWMADHSRATPAELREATVAISKNVWNQYYAPVLGAKDTPLLGIYSHMISYPLYLFNYPLGHLISFQIEEQVKKKGTVGPEIERMSVQGAVSPDVWMKGATGAPVSAEPLLRATEAALTSAAPSDSRPAQVH
jgi:hypothetical protein